MECCKNLLSDAQGIRKYKPVVMIKQSFRTMSETSLTRYTTVNSVAFNNICCWGARLGDQSSVMMI